MNDKEFLVNAIELVDIGGAANIPTVLYYPNVGPPAFGSEALGLAQKRRDLNEDFKIDLGNLKAGTSGPRRQFQTASGGKKSAAELTADFIHELLQHVSKWMLERDLRVATGVMVAEPLSMIAESSSVEVSEAGPEHRVEVNQADLVSKDWLQNYRTNLKRILLGKGFHEDQIKFLPEPFAVFQYYRHGCRHPLVAGRKKHNALVIDFGGGTFDVCIVETTKEGEIDINDAKRLSKPRSAASKPIGGFYVNRVIIEQLLRKYLSSRNVAGKLNTGLELYRKWRRNEVPLAGLAEEQRHFIQQFDSLCHEVEEPKLALSRSITDWRLDCSLSISVPVAIPENPFAAASPVMNCQLSGTEFRDWFVKRVWEQQVMGVVKKALERAREELSGAPITVALLSGGSANLKWMRELLKRDFAEDLSSSQVLELKDYQEVVAKGLAVECVRRFYEPQGDFSSVTYNRLCLVLDPDSSGLRLKRFDPKTAGLPCTDVAGVLLPSSSALGRLIGEPMKWKVRLDREPRHRLDYYFLRSSFDPSEVGSVQNVEEHTVYTPEGCRCDSAMQIELKVAEDGTATPRFIYKSGRAVAETIASQGRPFYLDMTMGQPDSLPIAYVGLDFGTSNTSVSFVSQASIQVYEKRSQETVWNDLSDLISTLPYPLAVPLATYVSSETSRLVASARDFVEAALTVAAYLTYLEYCAHKGRAVTHLFGGFPKRSAGPLWNLFKQSIQATSGVATFSACLKELTEPPHYKVIDQFVTQIAKEKHGKINDQEMETVRPVQVLANVLQRAFTDKKFGLFQQVQRRRFGKTFQGRFVHAIGRQPFVTFSNYEGDQSFSQDEPFVIYSDIALPLQPLMFWNHCRKHPEEHCGHCYFFDTVESSGVFSFKAVGFPCTCLVSSDNEFGPLAEELENFTKCDPTITFHKIGALRHEECVIAVPT
jgi:hypothetical protein